MPSYPYKDPKNLNGSPGYTNLNTTTAPQGVTLPPQPQQPQTTNTGNYWGQYANYGKPVQNAMGMVKNAKQGSMSPYGTESGPGILEQWFNERATGTDPAFEYGLKRGMTTLGNRYSAMGSFNSGANAQAGSDLYANLLSQRMGQLDSLAGGASNEHLNRLAMMFGQGMGLAGGQAGTATAYDTAAAGNMQNAANNQQQLGLNKAGVDAKAFQSLLNNGMNVYALSQLGGGGAANPYYNASNPYPV